jgi:large subunit ribosomal protein L25
MQWDYLGTTLAHVDLARVDLTEKVRLEVEIELVGEPVGAKAAGAFLQKFHNEIEIECLASQIPESIKIDVTKLEAGEHLSVRDIPLPEGVKAITDPDVAIVGILIAKEEEAAAPVEGAATEPEVIGRKVEEGEDSAAADGDKKAAEKKPAEKKGDKK